MARAGRARRPSDRQAARRGRPDGSRTRRGGEHRRGQACQLRRGVDVDRQGRGLLVQIHAEARRQRSEALVDRPQPFLPGRIQHRAGAHDVAVMAIEHCGLLGVELQPSRRATRSAMRANTRASIPTASWCAARRGSIRASNARRSGVESVLDAFSNRCCARCSRAPARSSAAIVSSKHGGHGPPAIASTSVRCSAIAASSSGPRSMSKGRGSNAPSAAIRERSAVRRAGGVERPFEPLQALDAAGQRRVRAQERRADVLGLDGHEVEQVAGRGLAQVGGREELELARDSPQGAGERRGPAGERGGAGVGDELAVPREAEGAEP